jgi:hypothetical protein
MTHQPGIPQPARPGTRARPPSHAPAGTGLADDLRGSGAPAGLRPFTAEVDLAELDERDRPGPAWSAQCRHISRSQLVVTSRRMCYEGRLLLAAIHLVDDRPTPLCGQVMRCEYDSDGLHLILLDLRPIPDRLDVAAWFDGR